MAKTYLYLTSLLLLGFLLSSCGKSEKADDDNWKKEIAMAHECGESGLPCCVDVQPACFHAQQCCADANDPVRTVCADSCDCGGESQFCCAGNECDDGYACDSGYCVKCGEEGNPCCATSTACVLESANDNTRTGCVNSRCAKCGQGGNAVCPREPACNDGHLMNNGSCLTCGGFNQPCCQDGRCDENQRLRCDLGFCVF